MRLRVLSNKAIRLRRIMPSKISIILQMIQKLNSINGLLFLQNNLRSKTSQNMLTSIDVKFIFNCLFYRQVWEIKPKRIVQCCKYSPKSRCLLKCLLAVLAMFLANIVCLFLPRERSEMLHQFVLTTKTTRPPHPKVFQVNCSVFWQLCHTIDIIFLILPIRNQPIKNGEIF